MKRLLVVTDSSPEASFAIDHALKLARAIVGVELVVLYAEPTRANWQERRKPRIGQTPAFVLRRAEARAGAESVTCRTRHEIGDIAELVARIASEEDCDLIVMPEKCMGPIERAVLMVTGLCAATALKQVIAVAPVPVTVVSLDVERTMSHREARSEH